VWDASPEFGAWPVTVQKAGPGSRAAPALAPLVGAYSARRPAACAAKEEGSRKRVREPQDRRRLAGSRRLSSVLPDIILAQMF
jgi:hypothetical protein